MPTSTISFNYPYYPSVSLPPGTLSFIALILGSLFAVGLILVIMERLIPAAPINRTIGIVVMIAAVLIFAAVFLYARNAAELSLPVFSPHAMLSTLWVNYERQYIDPASGRTFDTQRQNDTTSEGEGYTMLRAVWMDDETTFDQSWNWTAAHLETSNHLFSWLYGALPNGTEGVLVSQNGQNSASDADTDIALALVFAYARWQKPAYLQQAIPVIRSIWKNEVISAQGKPYLAPNDVTSPSSRFIEINPSYFSPYAYRIFAVLDPQDRWTNLIDTSYELLDKSMTQPLGGPSSAGLPPDWMQLDTQTGSLLPSANPVETTNFGYDAIRVPWRIALDWEWFKEPRAKATLQKMGFLSKAWQTQEKLYAIYTHAGAPAANYEAPAAYGGTMGYFIVADPRGAAAVYAKKLVSLYDPDTETWKLPLSYYDANIAWFGMALYNGELPNLFTALSSQASLN
ncbi:MAG: hypothetical protein KGJ13_05875 [Patescibacteria group bacterium]|nr:hypothetical protein [Patescibacteria group bacterium]